MVIIKKKGGAGVQKWKSLQLNESILANGIEGLIGIEELTDYTLVKKKPSYRDYDEGAETQTRAVRVRALKTDLSTSVVEESRLQLPFPVPFPVVEPVVKKKKKRNPNRGKAKKKSEIVGNKVIDKITVSSAVAPGTNKTEKRNTAAKLKKKKAAKTRIDLSTAQIDEQHNSVKSKTTKRNMVETLPNEPATKKKKKTPRENLNKATESNNLNVKEPLVKSKKSAKRIKEYKIDKVARKKIKNKKTLGPILKDVSRQNNNVTTQIHGMEGWAGLNLPDSILMALCEKGFKEPTEIQSRSLPAAVLGRRDIMGAAETGSGKTLAFGIPILYGILQQRKKLASNSTGITEDMNEDAVPEPVEPEMSQYPHSDNESDDQGMDTDGIGCVRVIHNVVFDEMHGEKPVATKPVNPAYNQKLYALVLTPTRELAIQVKDHLEAAAKYTGIRVAVVVGGLAHQKQERLLRTKPEIVVATPGRLWELIQEGNPYLQQVNDISYLAIDETDRMIERGHFQELQELLERINSDNTKMKRRQNFVFSATLTMVHEPPWRKKGKAQMRVTPGQKLQDVVKMLGMTQPKVVDVTRQEGTARTLEEAQIRCTFDEKDIYLYYFLISHPGRTLIFCNSISCVRRLAQLLTILRCKPLPIHANMVQKQRLRNLDKFIANPTGLLLATDVAARGLDIPDVQHVVHYQVPRTSEGYVHRSGRTARASKEGLTLLLVEPEEQQMYTRLCRTLGRDQELPAFEVSQDLLTAAKQRVKLARDIDQLELTSRRSDAEIGWFQKALTDMDMVLDKDELPMRISEEDTIGNRRMANEKRKQLESLLSRRLFSSRE